MIYAIPVFAVVALLACAGETLVEVTPGVEVTREVEATQTVEVVATASPLPTATAVVETATVAPEGEQKTPLEVPDRGYNTLGSPDAPVTLFDFSDFT